MCLGRDVKWSAMPNYCGNRLRVNAGSIEGLDRLMATIAGCGDSRDEPLSFASFLPVPNDMPDETPEADLSGSLRALAGSGDPINAYTWRVRNWGTRSDARTWKISRPEGSTEVEIYFDTAWSPPIPAITSLGGLFPTIDLTLVSWEPSNDFALKLHIRGGTLVDISDLDGVDAGAMLTAEGLGDVWCDDEEFQDE